MCDAIVWLARLTVKNIVQRPGICAKAVLASLCQRVVERDEVNLMDENLTVGRKIDWIEDEHSEHFSGVEA